MVVAASDVPPADGGVMVVVEEEVAVESDGEFGGVDPVGDSAESGARTITVLVDVAVRPVWSVAT